MKCEETIEFEANCDDCKFGKTKDDEHPCRDCKNNWKESEMPRERRLLLWTGKSCVDCDNCPAGNQDKNYCKDVVKCYGWRDKPLRDTQKEEPKETVNHPEHYNFGKYECIDEMIHLFGVEAVKDFCKCNAYKYRFRAGHKNGEEDIKKAEWYMGKLMELQNAENSR